MTNILNDNERKPYLRRARSQRHRGRDYTLRARRQADAVRRLLGRAGHRLGRAAQSQRAADRQRPQRLLPQEAA